MTWFIGVVIVVFVLDILGKAQMLYERDFERKPQAMVWDIALNAGFIAWAAFLLGSN